MNQPRPCSPGDAPAHTASPCAGLSGCAAHGPAASSPAIRLVAAAERSASRVCRVRTLTQALSLAACDVSLLYPRASVWYVLAQSLLLGKDRAWPERAPPEEAGQAVQGLPQDEGTECSLMPTRL